MHIEGALSQVSHLAIHQNATLIFKNQPLTEPRLKSSTANRQLA